MPKKRSGSVISEILDHPYFKEMDSDTLKNMLDKKNNVRPACTIDSHPQTPVTQTNNEITSIPSQGIIINSPGKYSFMNDLHWFPTQSSVAITIDSSDVILDMSNFTLFVHQSNPQEQFIGIKVENHDTITIQNGTINKPTCCGISCSSVSGLNILNTKVIGLTYTNYHTEYASPCGIFIESSDIFLLDQCFVANMDVTSASCAGVQIIKGSNGQILNCQMQNFVNRDGGAQGFSFIDCDTINTENSHCIRFETYYQGKTITSGHTAIGFIPIGCTTLSYINCSSNIIIGCCDDSHGMSIFLNMGVTVTGFKANNIADGITETRTGAKATGIEVYGAEVKIEDSHAENILAIVPQDRQCAGFSAAGWGITFFNCSASKVTALDSLGGPSAENFGLGFGWAPDPRPEFKEMVADQTRYMNCAATDCQVGFDTWNHQNSIWQNVTASGCNQFIKVEPYGATRNFFMNKCSEDPNPKPDGGFNEYTVTNLAENNTYPPN